MPHSYCYDKYLQSYDFYYCNCMQQRIFAGRSQGYKFIRPESLRDNGSQTDIS